MTASPDAGSPYYIYHVIVLCEPALAARRASGSRYERIRVPLGRITHIIWLCATQSGCRPASASVLERETIGSVATRALTEDSVEMEFLTDDPVAQAVTYQRVTFDARAPRCGR